MSSNFDDYTFQELYFSPDWAFPWRANTPENWEARTAKTRCHTFADGPQPEECPVVPPENAGEES